jgi:hypothetical protein
MERKAHAWMIGAILACAAPAPFAATRVEEVVVRPNPAVFVDGAPPQVEIAVTVSRGQFDRQSCDVIIEPGDGGSVARLSFGVADERTKSLRYTYQTPGSYQLKALGGHGCSGSRSVNVTVRATPDAAPSASSATASGEPAAPPGASCPPGWWLVPESIDGARYTCRPNLPSRPLTCASGTRYFSENGVIGCR